MNWKSVNLRITRISAQTRNEKTNAQLQLTYDLVQLTGQNIFLTGKAGMGKTTFLHNLKEHPPKRLAVIIPHRCGSHRCGGRYYPFLFSGFLHPMFGNGY